MADKTISQLPQLPGNLTSDAIFAIMQNGVTYETQLSELVTLIADNLPNIIPEVNVTATFQGSSSNPSVTLTRDSLRVFPVGRLAYISGRITWEGLSGGSGALEIHLSDSSFAPASAWDVLGIRAQGITPSDISNAAEGLVLNGAGGHFRISVLRGAASPQTLSPSDLSTSGDMTLSGWYQR